MPRRECRQSTLAQSPVGFVEICTCGSIHVGVGPLTLRIDPVAFERFATMVDEARRNLRAGVWAPEAVAQFVRVSSDPS